MPTPSLNPLSPIRVAPGGRYFETFDGDPFLFFGPNDAISWPGLAGLYRRRDMAGADAYLETLARNGVTILRLMLEYAHRDGWYFERPFGTFNPVLVRLWDDLFAGCARHGLRVLLTPWDTFWMARRWGRHPYNSANGGPADSPADFFTQERVIEAVLNRLRFVVERWGGDGTLAAWDLFNEIHPHWGGTAAQQSAVIAQLSDGVREIERRAWGFTRPQTVSIFGPDPSEEYETLILRHPSLDFATTHIYQGAIDYPRDTIEPALTLAAWVRHALGRLAPSRPFTDTEHGPIHLFNDHKQMLPEAFDDEYERHLMWAHLASGGAGGGMRWPARHPHLLTPGMLGAVSSLAGFVRLIDWRHFTPRDAARDVTTEADGVCVFGCRDDRQAVVWLLRDTRRGAAGQAGFGEVRLRGLLPGAYEVTPWQTAAGAAEAKQVLPLEAGELRIRLPFGATDLALAVRPASRQP